MGFFSCSHNWDSGGVCEYESGVHHCTKCKKEEFCHYIPNRSTCRKENTKWNHKGFSVMSMCSKSGQVTRR